MHLRRIGERLDAIEKALAVALAEPHPALREQRLEVLGRAASALRDEHRQAQEEQKRHGLRIVRDGAHPFPVSRGRRAIQLQEFSRERSRSPPTWLLHYAA